MCVKRDPKILEKVSSLRIIIFQTRIRRERLEKNFVEVEALYETESKLYLSMECLPMDLSRLE